jgi:hypothetical protein
MKSANNEKCAIRYCLPLEMLDTRQNYRMLDFRKIQSKIQLSDFSKSQNWQNRWLHLRRKRIAKAATASIWLPISSLYRTASNYTI